MNDLSKEFTGKVVIITGSQRGIGLETAKLFASRGASVVIADLPSSQISEAAKAAAEFGEVTFQTADISSEESVKSLIDFTLDRYGRLDILDNNATLHGLVDDTDILNMDPDLWDKVFSVNGRGTMLMCKHAIPAMLKTGGGSIVNISSGTSLAGQLSQSAYACSKGAINTLTQYVATQYGHLGIRCNALALGLVKTEALANGLPLPFQQLFIENKLAGRLGQPRDIAEMVAFISSDRASWITGQVYSVDGGYFAHGPQVAAERQLITSFSNE